MSQTSKKQAINFRPGSVVVGKWHNKRYVIKKPLGRGAIGSVYLCEWNGKDVALKISDKGSSITMEVNVLKTFQKVQGSRLGPSLLDVDDWIAPQGNQFSFYVMEYLKGTELSTFLLNKGEEWLGILILQLLSDLEALHQAGWVFGDLKSDNLLVTYPPPRLRWIDVGGTTQIGRSIKEYTEFYDRGYWNMGSRRAEPSYDLFAVAMIMIQLYHPNQFKRGSQPSKTLISKLANTPKLHLYQPCIKKALTGQYRSSLEMKQELSELIMNQPESRMKKSNHVNHQQQRRVNKRKNSAPKTKSPFMECMGIIVTVLLFYLLYLGLM